MWLDPLEVQDLRTHVGLIASWMPADRRDPAQWFTSEREAEPGMPTVTVLPPGTVVELKDARRSIKVTIETDVRPDRTARKALKSFL